MSQVYVFRVKTAWRGFAPGDHLIWDLSDSQPYWRETPVTLDPGELMAGEIGGILECITPAPRPSSVLSLLPPARPSGLPLAASPTGRPRQTRLRRVP